MENANKEVTIEILAELLEDKIRLLLDEDRDNSQQIRNLIEAWKTLTKSEYTLSPITPSTPIVSPYYTTSTCSSSVSTVKPMEPLKPTTTAK